MLTPDITDHLPANLRRRGDDWGYDVRPTSDGGFIVVGRTTPARSDNSSFYLVRTDAYGNVLWTRAIGGSGYEDAYCVRQTDDGGYIVAGNTTSFGAGHYDFYLVKTDANGDTSWTGTFGWEMEDGAASVQQTTDGGYVVAGSARPGGWPEDLYVIKTNASGETTWTRTYGGESSDCGCSIQQTSDGGYIIVGHTASFGAGSYDIYLVKTDANGDTVWTRTYGGADRDEGHDVDVTSDGGYIIAGATYSFGAGSRKVYLVRTDADGDTLWTKVYGRTDYDEANSVQQTFDGGYIIAGLAYGAGVLLIKTDANGDTLWTRTFGGGAGCQGYSVRQTTDSGYVVAGGADSDVLLIRTDPEGRIGAE